MGSEFAFEDIGSQEIEKFRYRYLQEEPCGEGYQCHAIERIPQYENSGYTRKLPGSIPSTTEMLKLNFMIARMPC